MRRAVVGGVTAVLCLALGPLQALRGAEKAPHRARWTVMIYMCADNNLASEGLADIEELEAVGSGDGVEVVVQFDGSPAHSPGHAGTFRLHVERHPEAGPGPVEEDSPAETDTGDPEALVSFVEWAVERWPASRYALIIWNHGNGWYPDPGPHRSRAPGAGGIPMPRAIAHDTTSDDVLTIDELAHALERIRRDVLHGRPLDLLGMDACLMGMAEVLYEIRGSARVTVASEMIEPGDGWPYDTILREFRERTRLGRLQAASLIVEAFVRSYDHGSQGVSDCTLAAIRTDERSMDKLAERCRVLVSALTSTGPATRRTCREVVERTQNFELKDWNDRYYTTHRDLKDFCERLAAHAEDRRVEQAALRLARTLDRLVIRSAVADPVPPRSLAGANGMAVYLPLAEPELETYDRLSFAHDAAWLKLVRWLAGKD